MKKWILLVIALQVLALLSIAVKREWIHSYGETVFLRTAPVDPRDLFRGDYVQLQYDIAFPESSMVSDELTQALELDSQIHRQIYVSLIKNDDGVAEIGRIQSSQPDDVIFIKGQIGRKLWRSWRQNGNIKFGIEKYFVEQGTGLALEERRGRAQEWQTALEVEVALGGDGTAVIRGHRWSDMSVKMEVLQPATNPTANQNEDLPQRRNPKVAMHLRNDSKHLIGIVDTPSHCSFKLIQNEGSQLGITSALLPLSFPARDCEAEPRTVHTLAADEIYSITLDFEDPQWFIKHGNEEIAIVNFPATWAGFRLEFKPPKDLDSNLENGGKIWSSNIRSARFNASGRID